MWRNAVAAQAGTPAEFVPLLSADMETAAETLSAAQAPEMPVSMKKEELATRNQGENVRKKGLRSQSKF